MRKCAVKLVENTVVLIESTKFGFEVFVDLIDLDGLALHPQVPQLDVHVITSGHQVAVIAKGKVSNTGNDFRKEVARPGFFRIRKNYKKKKTPV